MGRLNYGPYLYDGKVKPFVKQKLSSLFLNYLSHLHPNNQIFSCLSLLIVESTISEFLARFFQGILSSVFLDGRILHKWRMYTMPFTNLNEVPKFSPSILAAYTGLISTSSRKRLKEKYGMHYWMGRSPCSLITLCFLRTSNNTIERREWTSNASLFPLQWTFQKNQHTMQANSILTKKNKFKIRLFHCVAGAKE